MLVWIRSLRVMEALSSCVLLFILGIEPEVEESVSDMPCQLTIYLSQLLILHS